MAKLLNLDEIYGKAATFPAAPQPTPTPATTPSPAAPLATPAPIPTPLTAAAPRPTAQFDGGGGEYPGSPASTFPSQPPSTSPAPPGPPPAPAAGCPDSTPNGPADCCPSGTVWRRDTKTCEAPDARSRADQDTCPPTPGSRYHGGAPGPGYWCDFDTMEWRQGYIGPGGGGGGGGTGGGGGSRGPAIAPGAQSTAFGSELERMIRDLMASPSRFSPEALQSIYGEITRQSSGQIARGERGVRAEAARRGMSRAGSTGAALRAVTAGAEQQRGSAVVGVQMEKIKADFQDKLAGLDRAQRYLDSLRDNEYRYMLAAEQRRQFDANLALGYANLNQQRAMLQMQLQSAWDMLRASQGFNLLTGGV